MIRFKDYLSEWKYHASRPLSFALHVVFTVFAVAVMPISAAYYGIRIGWQVAKDEVLK